MKVLEVTSELDGGGVDRILFDYCSRIIPDIKFDFIVTSKFEGILEKPLRNLGCKIFHIAQMREDYNLHNRQLSEILKTGHYDIVHDHSGYKATINLRLAKKFNVKGRIAHSHIANIPETVKARLERYFFTPLTKYYATNLFACGRDAANWMWGNSETYIMNNAINTSVFRFDENKRLQIRKQLGLQDKFVIGNVARFSYQKNHEYLIKIFYEIAKLNEKAVLMLVGRGELYDKVKLQVAEAGLIDKVLFLGVRNDVPNLLNAMDVFLLPSRYEGLGMVLIEAQANCLDCFTSKDVVPNEAAITNYLNFISLNKNPSQWASLINRRNTKRRIDNYTLELIRLSGFDIDNEAVKLKELYIKICQH